MKNKDVVNCWLMGKPARSNNGNLSTDGKDLFSYRMRIGRTKDSKKQVLDIRGSYCFSKTILNHVGLCSMADERIEPAKIDNQWFFPDELMGARLSQYKKQQGWETRQKRAMRRQPRNLKVSQILCYDIKKWHRACRIVDIVLRYNSIYEYENGSERGTYAKKLGLGFCKLSGIVKIYFDENDIRVANNAYIDVTW